MLTFFELPLGVLSLRGPMSLGSCSFPGSRAPEMVALALGGLCLAARAVNWPLVANRKLLKSEQLLGTPRVAYWPAKCSQVFPGSAKYAMPPFWGHRVVPCWRRGRTPIVRPGPQGCRPRPLAAPCGPREGGEPSSRACRAVRPSRHCHASRSSQLPTGAAARVWPAVPSWVVPFRHFPGKRGVWCLLLLSL